MGQTSARSRLCSTPAPETAAALPGPRVRMVSRQRLIAPVRMHKASRTHRTRTWVRRYRTWLVMVLMLSVLGSGGALVGGWLGKVFYSYNPSFYEPKDSEREVYLNRLERERSAHR